METDLDVLSHPDDIPVDPPEILAEHAVARIEVRDQEHAIEQQRVHEMELTHQHAAGQALLGLGMGGGLFRNTAAPAAPVYSRSYRLLLKDVQRPANGHRD